MLMNYHIGRLVLTLLYVGAFVAADIWWFSFCRLKHCFSLQISKFYMGFLLTIYHSKYCSVKRENTSYRFIFFLCFADRASQYIYLTIDQLDALNFIMSLFYASTCFEHKCSSSGGQSCTVQSLVSSH